jgi:flagellar hook-basal body complex protein FliE
VSVAPITASVVLPTLPTLPAGAGGAVGGTGAATAAAGAGGVTGPDFGDVMANAIENVTAAQAKADRLAVDAATGQLTDVHDYMIAATEASLATELTVAVRNKAVEAFNQIMTMGV